jgi:hypothetical protein
MHISNVSKLTLISNVSILILESRLSTLISNVSILILESRLSTGAGQDFLLSPPKTEPSSLNYVIPSDT